MNIGQYQQLTGRNVKPSQTSSVMAMLKRSQSELEMLLGFTLSEELRQENLYTQIGVSNECFCLGENDDSDREEKAYRLYPYNPSDRYLHVDPFTTLYKVKLVKNGYTLRTFDTDEVRAQFKQGWSKYIQVCETCFCVCDCTDCVQLAVDADWSFNCEDDSCCWPTELQYLLIDLIDWELNCNKDIKKKTVGTTSWEKFDRSHPIALDKNIAIIQKYRGPLGVNANLPV